MQVLGTKALNLKVLFGDEWATFKFMQFLSGHSEDSETVRRLCPDEPMVGDRPVPDQQHPLPPPPPGDEDMQDLDEDMDEEDDLMPDPPPHPYPQHPKFIPRPPISTGSTRHPRSPVSTGGSVMSVQPQPPPNPKPYKAFNPPVKASAKTESS